MTFSKVLVQSDLLVYHSNNMRKFALENLYKFLEIPESEIAKFFDTSIESFLEDPSKQMNKPFDMKLYVTRMPESKYECRFHKWGMSYTSNGCEETHECKFGGDCDFKNGRCSRINALKGNDEL